MTHLQTCSTCGAPLDLTVEEDCFTCEHCGTQVANPNPPGAKQGAGHLSEELEQVEKWWEEKRRPYMTEDRRGNLIPPAEQNILWVVLIAVGAILGLLAAMGGHSIDSKALGIAGFFLFPICISLPAALLQQRAEAKYKEYKKLEAEYQGRRNAIIDRQQSTRASSK